MDYTFKKSDSQCDFMRLNTIVYVWGWTHVFYIENNSLQDLKTTVMVATVMIFRHTELKLYPMQKGEASYQYQITGNVSSNL